MSDALLNAGRQTLMLELQEASRLPERLGDDFVRAANIIIHCEGKVIVSGIGKSGHIGKKIAATLASTGTPAFFVHPAEALHGDLGMIESRDVMLFISYSGGAKELDLIIPRLEDKSVALLAMTGKLHSPLGRAAKAVLDISVEREACPMHLAPTSSTVNTLMMGDALAMAVMQARGFNEEDFARSHPAGALGARLLNNVHHLMRQGDAIPQVMLATSVMDAMLELSRTGLGLVAVCDEQHVVKGVFTDGDLRRWLVGGGAVDRLSTRLQDAGFEMSLSLKAKWRPDLDALELCRQHGRDIARQWALAPLPETTQKTAPVEETTTCAAADLGPKMQCSVCQWIYDPALGEPLQDVAPGTPWSDVPDNFLCPECSLGKDVFDVLATEAK
ncbi:arabinose-5-phosphate isomerase GutQ [Salmonella enterica subsp. enterica]|nr:arabinose-5-phosphate isomerase GutQ [Salmonella enterica subsp. enterica serovar Indiana]EDB3257777.1 arabinose-5-phosphate isomerase GutQ [Salmonella enterica subsp. enterica serovar Indiana]EDV2553821.1 arabinose-5-phosphate isomerase GutQ [Salmonella enterica subsp. enterica]